MLRRRTIDPRPRASWSADFKVSVSESSHRNVVRLCAGAAVTTDWRSAGSMFLSGPSFLFNGPIHMPQNLFLHYLPFCNARFLTQPFQTPYTDLQHSRSFPLPIFCWLIFQEEYHLSLYVWCRTGYWRRLMKRWWSERESGAFPFVFANINVAVLIMFGFFQGSASPYLEYLRDFLSILLKELLSSDPFYPHRIFYESN